MSLTDRIRAGHPAARATLSRLSTRPPSVIVVGEHPHGRMAVRQPWLSLLPVRWPAKDLTPYLSSEDDR